jgi:hypothetical protein
MILPNCMEIGSTGLEGMDMPFYAVAYETYRFDADGDDRRGTSELYDTGLIAADTRSDLIEMMAVMMVNDVKTNNRDKSLTDETTFSQIMKVSEVFTHTTDEIFATTTYQDYLQKEAEEKARVAAEAEKKQQMNDKKKEDAARELYLQLKKQFEPNS